MCTERENRMRNYLSSVRSFQDIDLNKLLILDRFDWNKKSDIKILLSSLYQILKDDLGIDTFRRYLGSYLSSDLQRKNLELVSGPAYKVLLEYVNRENI